MSVGTIPYQLRQNKAVERNLFLEVLSAVRKKYEISEYWYIGLGGAFLEDFKIIHNQFGIHNLISIEKNQSIFKRQNFNKPLGSIDLKNSELSDFIRNLDTQSENYIIWLDYESPKDLERQLQNIQLLIEKLSVGDIVKVTMNANAEALERGSRENNENLPFREFQLHNRHETFKERAGSYYPPGLTDDDFKEGNYPTILKNSIKLSVNAGLKGQIGLGFMPLSSFQYLDNRHRMLTLTGIIFEKDERDVLIEEIGLSGWKFLQTQWGDFPFEISLPELTASERTYLDQHIPDYSASDIVSKDEICIADGKEKNEKKYIKQYFDYYRHFPFYGKVNY